MGATAEARLDKADRLNAKATKIRKRDPDSARELDAIARSMRKGAIKQMKRKPPKRNSLNARVLGA